jgi:hypothetical protein
MTQLGGEVQKKMLDLKIGNYLQEESLKDFLSNLEGICDEQHANELIGEVEKNVEEYAKNFELLRMELDDSDEDIGLTPNIQAPEHLKEQNKTAATIFTSWDKESLRKFEESLKHCQDKFKK